MSDTPEVVFICIRNAGRSQMAAALVTHYAGDRIIVRSAGTAPADTINPTVIEAMNELGIELTNTHATPKLLTDKAVADSDVVITMGCGDQCPYYPAKRYEDWQLDDPPCKHSLVTPEALVGTSVLDGVAVPLFDEQPIMAMTMANHPRHLR